MSIRFPAQTYPRGWFQVAWSGDLAPGDVRPLDYFGEKLVLWRGESGEVFLQSAFCLHLGAHRGIKGSVCGDDLVCPWHGWQWDGEGRNTVIPYSSEGCKPKLRIRTYPVREWCGLLVAWLDPAGGPPTWDPPIVPEYDHTDFYPMHPFSDRVHRIRAHPQMPIENAVDPAHIKYVHGAAEVPRVVHMEMDGHWCRVDVELVYGAGKAGTAVTPGGERRAVVRMECYGIGISVIHWDDTLLPGAELTCFTPVDGEYMDYWFSMTARRAPGDTGDEPTGTARAAIEMQWKVIEEDFFTWENMAYLPTPNFAAEEAKHYAALRRWAAQFYPENETDLLLPAGDGPPGNPETANGQGSHRPAAVR